MVQFICSTESYRKEFLVEERRLKTSPKAIEKEIMVKRDKPEMVAATGNTAQTRGDGKLSENRASCRKLAPKGQK